MLDEFEKDYSTDDKLNNFVRQLLILAVENVPKKLLEELLKDFNLKLKIKYKLDETKEEAR